MHAKESTADAQTFKETYEDPPLVFEPVLDKEGRPVAPVKLEDPSVPKQSDAYGDRPLTPEEMAVLPFHVGEMMPFKGLWLRVSSITLKKITFECAGTTGRRKK